MQNSSTHDIQQARPELILDSARFGPVLDLEMSYLHHYQIVDFWICCTFNYAIRVL